MSGLSVFRLVGNVSVNGGYGVAEVAEFGLPASTIRTGRFTNDRLPLDPQITGNLTPSANSVYSLGNAAYQWRDLYLGGEVTGNLVPSANLTYSLGSADKRWKDLYLSGNTLYLGNTVISTATSTTTAGNITTTDLIIDGSRTIQTVGRTLADSYSSSGYSTNARPDLVQTSVAANTANVVVSTWTTQRSAVDNNWFSMTWAAELGLFCAVAHSGTGNRVMTSPDGVTWTSRTSAVDNDWRSVVWASELGIFVAVANSGTGNRVMTSPNGINWTARTSAADNQWLSVCWAPELSLFVAVAQSGTGNRVMTSPNGINWTTQTTNDNLWHSVVWAPELGIFVAVAYSGTGNRVMTSPDGVAWTLRTSAADNVWHGVTWAPKLGLFVAVAMSGTGNRVMTSPNGINWTLRTSAADNSWVSVVWAPEPGQFVAVARSGVGNRVMTSADGITWTSRKSAADNVWNSVCWAPELGIFAAVANTGTGNRVMTSASALSTRIVGATSFVGSSVTVDGNDLLTARDVRVTYPSEAPHGVTAGSYNYTGKKPALFRATTLSAVEAVSTWRAQGQSSVAEESWSTMCWSPDLGLFAALSTTGTGNRVMTSPDGVNWTARTSAADNAWTAICWSPELALFVGVSQGPGTNDRVMTSPDGINWTSRTTNDNDWWGVAWSPQLGLFVAVAVTGTGNRVMYSSNGTSWTCPAGTTTGFDNQWSNVCWAPEAPNGSGGRGLFVAVAWNTGTGNRVMYSANGINWTCPAGTTTGFDNNWRGLCWGAEAPNGSGGNGLFVAVSRNGTGNRVMTSPDGIVWTTRDTTGRDAEWLNVVWSSELGLFVATGDLNEANVMTSPDGVNWTSRPIPGNNGRWWGLAWAPELGIFCAVGNRTLPTRVMTSRSALQLEAAGEATFKNAVVVPKLGVGTATPNAPLVVFGGEGTYDAPNFGNGNRGAIHIRSSTTNRRNAITFANTFSAGLNADTAQAGIYVDETNQTGTTMHFATTQNYATGPQARATIGNTGNVGIGTTNPTAKLQVEGTCRIDNNPVVNTASLGYQLEARSTGTNIQGWGKGENRVALMYAVSPLSSGWSNTNSILYVTRDTGTSRSINAAGTVNASGADYAEYMTKKSGDDFVVAKGDVVGVDAAGFLTNVYDEAITFVIKSTNPSLVGGDDWAIEDAEHPKTPEPPSSPPGDDASEEEIAAYDAAVAAHDAWTAEFEAKRARVDRIAFSGQVPVNVYGATPGDYIVPVRRMDDGGISAIAVPDASITFEQYRKAVGKVVKILDDDDGRAFVIVKIA